LSTDFNNPPRNTNLCSGEDDGSEFPRVDVRAVSAQLVNLKSCIKRSGPAKLRAVACEDFQSRRDCALQLGLRAASYPGVTFVVRLNSEGVAPPLTRTKNVCVANTEVAALQRFRRFANSARSGLPIEREPNKIHSLFVQRRARELHEIIESFRAPLNKQKFTGRGGAVFYIRSLPASAPPSSLPSVLSC
jgi:hypothetical protein